MHASSTPPAPQRHIALLLHEDSSFIRGLLRGVRAYALPPRNWVFRIFRPESVHVGTVSAWRPDGVLTHAHDRRLADLVRGLGVPFVNVANTLDPPLEPLITVDDQALGRLAVEHLTDCGYSQLAFVGYAGWRFSALRQQGLAAAARARNLPPPRLLDMTVSRDGSLTPETVNRLGRWLAKLPKPVGVTTANDLLAFVAANHCREQGLRVPEDVALLGMDDDELICDLAFPPLSSLAIPLSRLGAVAAETLEGLMDRRASGRTLARRSASPPRLLEPQGLAQRESTSLEALRDPLVAAAMRFIHANRHRPFGVKELLQHVPSSRRVLERRFRSALGRTLHDEILRTRLDAAKRMLAQTDLPMSEVAERSGFGTQRLFSTTFRAATGRTPTEFRRAARGGSAGVG